MSINEAYVSPAEAAEILGKSYSTICRYVEKGQLEAKRERGILYVSRESLEAWVEPPKGNPNLLKRKRKKVTA